jgi:hypothetical protein
MTTKLGNCNRCFDPRPATTRERITFGSSSYDLELCDPHADLLRRDLYGWTRCGTLVEESTFRGRRRVEADEPATTRRGTVEASYIHIPIARVAAVEPPERPAGPPAAPPRGLRPPAESLLPQGYEEWTFTDHAMDRQGTRGIGREEALWCALAPDIARPGTRPGTLIHIRGRIQVVINPLQRKIITVIDRSQNTLDQEEELAHAASR